VPYGHQYLPAGRAHSECLGCWQSSGRALEDAAGIYAPIPAVR
jgi:hypothetical protein